MSTRRCRLGVATLGGRLCELCKIVTISTVCSNLRNSISDACGGYDGSSFLRSVEVYDANLDTWKQVAPMNVKRSRVALTANMGKLYGDYSSYFVQLLFSILISIFSSLKRSYRRLWRRVESLYGWGLRSSGRQMDVCFADEVPWWWCGRLCAGSSLVSTLVITPRCGELNIYCRNSYKFSNGDLHNLHTKL